MGEQSFLRKCGEVREAVERMREPLVVSHYDADGLASAGVVARALRKMKKKFSCKIFRKLGEEEIKQLKSEGELIFSDFGASSINLLEKLDASLVVIDHHQSAGKTCADEFERSSAAHASSLDEHSAKAAASREGSVLQANPCLHGFDGGSDISSSGTAFFVFGFPELADTAIVGAVGDMQAHSQSGLSGLNRKIVEIGEEAGVVKASRDLRLFGRNSRPLAPFLSFSTEPFIPGLTGNDDYCKRFVEEAGISLKQEEKWRNYFDLSEGERKELATALIVHLYSFGGVFASKELVGEVYSLPKQPAGTELSDAQEFSTLLNACGRNSQPEIGLRVCLGEEGALEEARKLLQVHRTNLREGIKFAQAKIEDFNSFHFLDARGTIPDGIIGVVAGMLYATISREKPVIAFSLDAESKIKISTRATNLLVARGVNLGLMLREACNGIGWGGGHNIAAGATIEPGKANEFLLAAAKQLKLQHAHRHENQLARTA